MKSIKIRKDKSGNSFINWICLKKECPQSCCGYFEDRSRCYESLYGLEHFDILISSKEADVLRDNGFKKHIERKGKKHCMKLSKNRECPFLKNNLCNIYDNRPKVCKAYPFYIDLFSGINIDMSCPGIGKGWSDLKDLKKYFLALSLIYEEHIEDIGDVFKK